MGLLPDRGAPLAAVRGKLGLDLNCAGDCALVLAKTLCQRQQKTFIGGLLVSGRVFGLQNEIRFKR